MPRTRFASETRLGLVRRARRMNRELAELYPDAHSELDFASPYQLLVATVLSAQTTDVRVNLVTRELFAAYPTPSALAAADPADVERMIVSTGFFRAKARAIIGMAQAVCERYGGEVPGRLDDLVTLPGVGRKTANVVLGNAFGVPGLTVDTHFGRLVRRFGWTTEEDPVKVEAAVGELIPKREWAVFSHRVIWHGRRVCHARKPACGACALAALCPSYGEGPTDRATAERLVKLGPSTSAPAQAASAHAASEEAASEEAASEEAASEEAASEEAASGKAAQAASVELAQTASVELAQASGDTVQMSTAPAARRTPVAVEAAG